MRQLRVNQYIKLYCVLLIKHVKGKFILIFLSFMVVIAHFSKVRFTNEK